MEIITKKIKPFLGVFNTITVTQNNDIYTDIFTGHKFKLEYRDGVECLPRLFIIDYWGVLSHGQNSNLKIDLDK